MAPDVLTLAGRVPDFHLSGFAKMNNTLDDFILRGCLFGLRKGSSRSSVLSLLGKPTEWETVGVGNQDKSDQIPTSCMYWYGRLVIGFHEDEIDCLALHYSPHRSRNDTSFDHRLPTGEIDFDYKTTDQEFMEMLAKCGASVEFHSTDANYSDVLVNEVIEVSFARFHRLVMEGDDVSLSAERFPDRSISTITTLDENYPFPSDMQS